MPSILIRPWTLTSPSEIPAAGATVTFTVEARASGTKPFEGRFEFQLRAADGYRWSNGSTRIQQTEQLTNDWQTFDIPLGLTRENDAGAVLLIVTVEGVLLTDGAPASTTKRSKAKLTVEQALAQHLAGFRSAHGLTQRALAEQVGVSASWMSDLEHGASASVAVLKSIKEVIES